MSAPGHDGDLLPGYATEDSNRIDAIALALAQEW
jgi:hypothetical protein